MKYYFLIDRKKELLEKHSMKEYAEFLEISIPYICQVLKGKRHVTKHLAYAISCYAGKNIDYYFKGVV